jgi:hypothetical protein
MGKEQSKEEVQQRDRCMSDIVFFFPPLSVQHVFHHVVIKIRQLFLRPAACLTSTLLETGVDDMSDRI